MQTTELTPDERAHLRSYLKQRFDLDELKDLAFDLGVNHEDLPHSTTGALSRGLIGYFERRGQIGCLVQEVVERRPDDALVRIMGKLPPCSPNKKIQIIIRGEERAIPREGLAELAELFGANPEEIEVIAAASDSVYILFGLRSSRFGGEEYGWFVPSRPEVMLLDFRALDKTSQTAWRLLSVCLPRRESGDYIRPAFSWEHVVGTVATGESQIAQLGERPRPMAALWFHAGQVLSSVPSPAGEEASPDLPRREEAMAAFSKAIEIDPSFTLAYFRRAAVKHDSGDVDGAVEDIVSATRALNFTELDRIGQRADEQADKAESE